MPQQENTASRVTSHNARQAHCSSRSARLNLSCNCACSCVLPCRTSAFRKAVCCLRLLIVRLTVHLRHKLVPYQGCARLIFAARKGDCPPGFSIFSGLQSIQMDATAGFRLQTKKKMIGSDRKPDMSIQFILKIIHCIRLDGCPNRRWLLFALARQACPCLSRPTA